MREGRRPAEFGEILSSPLRPIIVGGQAVNIWAEYFAVSDPAVARLQPFVSKDADIFADRETAEKLAERSGWQVRYFHEPRTIAVALLTKATSGNATLTVEVLREVRGLTRKELEDSDTVEIRRGETYRIPSPIRLMKAKIANTVQITPTRVQDLDHLKLLVPLATNYLREQHANVAAGHLKERVLINSLNELSDIISGKMAAAASRIAEIDFSVAIPRDLASDNLPKLAAFYVHDSRPRNAPGARNRI